MMKFLEQLAKIPLPRLVVTTLLILLVLVMIENLPWTQSVVEQLLNIEGMTK